MFIEWFLNSLYRVLGKTRKPGDPDVPFHGGGLYG